MRLGNQRTLRLAALFGPGIIAVTFETIRHAYLDAWLTETQGNILTGSLVIGASALLLKGIFRRLDRMEAETRRVQRERAALEERGRIAADLHDDVGQSLFYLNVKLNEVRRILANAPASQDNVGQGNVGQSIERQVAEDSESGDALVLLDDMRRALQQLNDRLRGTISELKAADACHDVPFVDAVRERLQRFQDKTGIPVAVGEVSHRCGPDCPGAEHEMLRLLQEALTNVSRHARAQHVRVTVRSQAERDEIIVADDGRGFHVESAPGVDEGHFGLTLMRERAANLGGRLHVRSRPGRGTTIRFERVHRPGGMPDAPGERPDAIGGRLGDVPAESGGATESAGALSPPSSTVARREDSHDAEG